MPLLKAHLHVVIMVTLTMSPSVCTSTAFVPILSQLHITHESMLNMAPRSSPSSPQPRTNRNRGANAANHNRKGHEFRLSKYSRRKNTKRAPRWEREGDQLYAEISKRIIKEEEDGLNTYFESLAKNPIESADDVHKFMKPWTITIEASMNEQSQTLEDDVITEPSLQVQQNKPPFLWGTLPVGPVLASRLYASHRSSPTSVQKAAFPILTSGKNNNAKRINAIIASPTGTGKTLAYLLPLLSTSPGGQFGEGMGGVLIVTPTIELACQIQREVNVLWPPDEKKGGHSALFVVGDSSDDKSVNGNDNNESQQLSPGRMILRSMDNSPIIAGTPKMLRMLYKEAERIDRFGKFDTTVLDKDVETSRALLTNMRAIVLDEADRLLRTEAAAREAAERKERKIAQRFAEQSNYDAPNSKKKLIIARETQTELLLRDLPIRSLEDVQIICASATVGRTMRRQLMQLLDAPSTDAAATLITGEDDARVKSKDSEKRRSVLLPEKLQHSYRVVDMISTEDVSEDLPETSLAEQHEEQMIRATVKSLWDTMSSLEAKPLLIFPGKIGVERIQQEMIGMGLEDVRTLRNLDGLTPEYPTNSQVVQSTNWKSIPVYIIGERFARGLDLAKVEYVAILSPPSSAAGYTHMAGRTGRSGKRGIAITFVRPKNNEVKRLVAIADTIGVRFCSQ